ncbi:MAG: hypothetical protein ACRDTO_01740 [Mycobacterium sp.]
MTKHVCMRCGLEARRSHGSWPDRHPAAAVTAALFTLTLMSMMLSTHPLAAMTVIALAAAGGAAYTINREHNRRRALAARADYEHALMARPLPSPPAMAPLPKPAVRPPNPAPWHPAALLPTNPLRAGRT